jgi:hypothetical protein
VLGGLAGKLIFSSLASFSDADPNGASDHRYCCAWLVVEAYSAYGLFFFCCYLPTCVAPIHASLICVVPIDDKLVSLMV